LLEEKMSPLLPTTRRFLKRVKRSAEMDSERNKTVLRISTNCTITFP
jgi:hypothetical protein